MIHFVYFIFSECRSNGWAIKNVTLRILLISDWFFVLTNPIFPQKIHRSTLYKTAYSFIQKSILFSLSIMKSKDLQKLALSKYEKGDSPSDIFRHLNGAVCLRTVKRWCKMIRETGSINLSTSPGRPRTARTKESIRKVKDRLRRPRKKNEEETAANRGFRRSSAVRLG